MTTLRQLRSQAQRLGVAVTVEREGHCRVCRTTAPDGYVFAGSGLHEHVDVVYVPWVNDYEDLLARMQYGLEPCPEGAECEWCHPEEEEN